MTTNGTRHGRRLAGALLMGLFALPSSVWAAALQPLKVGANHRFLVQADGTPFFYLADTAWELFHRTDRWQAAEYLEKRASQGFTVIQAVALAEVDGLSTPNMYGDLPLVDNDPTKPAVTPGANPQSPQEYDYWDHVDYIVEQANVRGLYVALLPTWGSWLGVKGDDPKIVNASNAQSYGEFLGRRYRHQGIVWVLGGDRTGDGFEDVWRALAKGIAIGVVGHEDYNAVLMSFHPRGGHSSSTWFHNDPWLSFNMQQTSHGPAATTQGWAKIGADYDRQPVKPVVDGEPLYEDHPIGFRGGSRQNGFSSDAHVRQRAYWHVFAGACGFAYGNHAIWRMYAPAGSTRATAT